MENGGRPVRVVVVSEDALFRCGVTHALGTDPCIEVVGEAVRGRDATTVLMRSRPDVVLIDVQLHEGTGLDMCRAVAMCGLDTRILVVTDDKTTESIRNYVELGARAYVLKSSTPAEILSAVYDVANGKLTFAPAIAQRVRAIMIGKPIKIPPHTWRDTLTARENQVLKQLEFGLRNREIAAMLGISKRTVECHVRNVLLKLGVNSRTQAVARMLRS